MSLYGIDHLVRLRLARDRAAQLRTDWGMANGRGLRRIVGRAGPCGDGVAHALAWATRLIIQLARRPRLATNDPCS